MKAANHGDRRDASAKSSRRPVHLAAGPVEVVFEWAADRWGHRVLVGGVVIVESVEGAGHDGEDDPRWPASPAIIELTAGNGPTPHLLGVGSAGRSHFSLVVAPHPIDPDTLRFEVACRVVASPGRMGSTYRTPHPPGGGAVVVPVPMAQPGPWPSTVRWSYDIGSRGIVPREDATLAAPPA
jgi:hypothetical protein